MDVLTVTLLTLLIGQQCFYMFNLQKLLNKLMSRNYHEYESATKPFEAPRMRSDQAPSEDLGVLSDINGII